MDKNQILKEAKEAIENVKAAQATLDTYLLRLEKIVDNLEYENLKKEKLLKSDVSNILAVLEQSNAKNKVDKPVIEERIKKDKNFSLSAILIFILGLTLLVVSSFITVNKYNPDTKFFNHYLYAYQASNMEPEVSNNSLVFIKGIKNQELKEGDNIAYKTGLNSIKVVKLSKKLEEKQDAYLAFSINHSFEDSEEILKNEVLGKVVFTLTSLGAIVLVLQDNLWLLYVTAFLIILISYLIKNKSKS